MIVWPWHPETLACSHAPTAYAGAGGVPRAYKGTAQVPGLPSEKTKSRKAGKKRCPSDQHRENPKKRLHSSASSS